MPTTDSQIAVSSGEDGPRTEQMSETVLASQQSWTLLVKARPPGFAKHSATTGLEVAESFGEGEAGSSWSGTTGTTSAAATAAAKSVGEVRPLGKAKYMVTAKSELAAAAMKSAGKVRPLGIAKQCDTTKPELAESSGGAGPSEASGMNCPAAAAVKSAGEARPSRIENPIPNS